LCYVEIFEYNEKKKPFKGHKGLFVARYIDSIEGIAKAIDSEIYSNMELIKCVEELLPDIINIAFCGSGLSNKMVKLFHKEFEKMESWDGNLDNIKPEYPNKLRIKHECPTNIAESRIKNGNPHGVIIGTDEKRNYEIVAEQIHDILTTRDDNVIVIDTDGRYKDLVDKYDGQLIRFGPGYHINPFDTFKSELPDRDDKVNRFEDTIFAFCEIIKECKLGTFEKSLIAHCVDLLYKNEDNTPLLQDFYNELEKNPATTVKGDKVNESLLTVLKPFVDGTCDMFAHKTNIVHRKRLVVYDLSTLPKELVTLSAFVILQHVSELYIYPQIKVNKGIRNWLFVDKVDLLLNESEAVSILSYHFKRFRMYYGVITGIMNKCSFNNQEVCTIVSICSYMHVTEVTDAEEDTYKKFLGIENDLWTNEEELIYMERDLYVFKGNREE